MNAKPGHLTVAGDMVDNRSPAERIAELLHRINNCAVVVFGHIEMIDECGEHSVSVKANSLKMRKMILEVGSLVEIMLKEDHGDGPVQNDEGAA